jgi:hypothetical protein
MAQLKLRPFKTTASRVFPQPVEPYPALKRWAIICCAYGAGFLRFASTLQIDNFWSPNCPQRRRWPEGQLYPLAYFFPSDGG